MKTLTSSVAAVLCLLAAGCAAPQASSEPTTERGRAGQPGMPASR